MTTIGDRIKSRREAIGLSVDDLATKLGKNRATVYRYESSDIENLPITILEPLAKILQTTPAYLMGWDSNVSPISLPTSVIQIPVLGSIPAGVPVEAVQDIIDWADIPEEWAHGDRQYFGLFVKGDSMFPEYMEGDTVIIRKQPCCDSGDDCAIIIDGIEATLKRIHLYEDGIELEAVNPMYGRKKYTSKEIENLPVIILGVVVELRRKKK
jgi:repressor LexA